MIVFMATKHMMGYKWRKKNKPSTIYVPQGRGGRRGEMSGKGRMQATPLHVRWIGCQWKFTV